MRTANDSGAAQPVTEASDVPSARTSRELKSRQKYASQPSGNYEYEQMVAEEASSKTKLIAEAAYLLAERRGFVPGNELSDWLQAETQVEDLLRATVVERRLGTVQDRRCAAGLKA